VTVSIHFLSDLWRSARRPRVLRRCLVIAAVVGTVLTTINLGDLILRGPLDVRLAMKIGANFVVPFIVSNLGAMASLPDRRSD
jgi:hypothetical protein